MMVAKLLRIHGRVQGVGYRESLKREARSLGLAGWVRNRSDSTVEAWVQGEEFAVQALLSWAAKGPPAARVDLVNSKDREPEADLEDFERRETI